MLKAVLKLYGEGIIASLEFTMKDYLKQTKGRLRTEAREEWELKMCRAMLRHNNAAECHIFGATAIQTLVCLSIH